jgi:hypothetical protein
MIKNGNKFIKPQKINYEQLINVWVDDTRRIEVVKRLMIADETFKLDKLRTNPVYVESYNSIIAERQRETTALDKSILWSRKFTKKKFNFFMAYVVIWGSIIYYIFFIHMKKRFYYLHVKYGLDFEELKSTGFWDLDFDNKDLYPERAIKEYFEVKKQKEYIRKEEEKALTYSDMFVQNISKGYISDYYKRRQYLGFNDED